MEQEEKRDRGKEGGGRRVPYSFTSVVWGSEPRGRSLDGVGSKRSHPSDYTGVGVEGPAWC